MALPPWACISNRTTTPITIQLIRLFGIYINEGVWKPDEAIPTAAQMAQQLNVPIINVVRAYKHLLKQQSINNGDQGFMQSEEDRPYTCSAGLLPNFIHSLRLNELTTTIDMLVPDLVLIPEQRIFDFITNRIAYYKSKMSGE